MWPLTLGSVQAPRSIASQGLTSKPQVRTQSWAADPYPEISPVAVQLGVQLAQKHVYRKHRT